MVYKKCYNSSCKFNVTEQDERCPNCGVLNPLKTLINTVRTYQTEEEEKRVVRKVQFIATPIVLIFIVIRFADSLGEYCVIPLAFVSLFIVPFIAGKIASFIIGEINEQKANQMDEEISYRKEPYKNSLESKEKIIEERKSQLSTRKWKLQPLISKAKLNVDKTWNYIGSEIEQHFQDIQYKEAEYNIKSVHIEIVRLQNTLEPFLYNLNPLSYKEIDMSLSQIKESQKMSDVIGKKLESLSKKLIDSVAYKNICQQSQEVQESIKSLKNAYISKQGELLQKSVNIKSNSSLLAIEKIKVSEIFQSQAAVINFLTLFDELEIEYVQFQQDKVFTKVDKFIKEASKP